MSEQSLSVDEIDARHGRYGEGFKNGWSLSLYNVIKGTNELRTSEYYDLIRELEWSAERIAQLERELAEANHQSNRELLQFAQQAVVLTQQVTDANERAEQSDLALAEARNLLSDIHDFLLPQEDADHNGSSFVPNQAMRFVQQIDAVLERK
jgi:hypothetical protein